MSLKKNRQLLGALQQAEKSAKASNRANSTFLSRPESHVQHTHAVSPDHAGEHQTQQHYDAHPLQPALAHRSQLNLPPPNRHSLISKSAYKQNMVARAHNIEEASTRQQQEKHKRILSYYDQRVNQMASKQHLSQDPYRNAVRSSLEAASLEKDMVGAQGNNQGQFPELASDQRRLVNQSYDFSSSKNAYAAGHGLQPGFE